MLSSNRNSLVEGVDFGHAVNTQIHVTIEKYAPDVGILVVDVDGTQSFSSKKRSENQNIKKIIYEHQIL
eukprot:jgi/Psemu1/304355/fgenesh1_kg.147_\